MACFVTFHCPISLAGMVYDQRGIETPGIILDQEASILMQFHVHEKAIALPWPLHWNVNFLLDKSIPGH